jgi:Zn-dependent protease with chaperone function
LGVPTAIVDASYSRIFEVEADRYALESMNAHGIDLDHFGAIMNRLERWGIDCDGEDEKDECMDEVDSPTKRNMLLNYLSTHPLTEDRVLLIEKYRK